MDATGRVLPAILLLLFGLAGLMKAQEIAVTFDDLPLNGGLPRGVARADITKNVLSILRERRMPRVFGFINARKLEGNPDGAEALKLWAAAEPAGNHTYSHMDLEANTVEAFERDIELNEPALELLARTGDDWRWLRYPFLHEGDTVEKRRAVRDYLKAHGYKIAQVSIDWEDYMWNDAYARCVTKNDKDAIVWLRTSYLNTASEFIDLDRQLAKLVFGHEIKYVLLMHLGAFSSTILPDAFDLLQKKGLKFITLEQAESDPAYATDPDAGLHDAGTLLDQWMQVKQIKYPEHAEKPYKQVQEICR